MTDAAASPRLSALIVARDEEQRLPDCIAALSFCDEVVVVLDRCRDRSKQAAEAAGARVIEGAWELEGPRRNAGIAACVGDWILEIDADERASPAFAAAVRAAIATAPKGFFKTPIANHIGGRLIRWGWGAYNGVAAKPILFSRGEKTWGAGRAHPKIELSGQAQSLTVALDHFVYRDVADMLDRLNRYSTATALDMVDDNRVGRLGPNVRRLFTRFFKSYVQRRGWKEGPTGLMLGLFAGLYPLLSYLKAVEIQARARITPP